jgi:uncharacterized protein (DUF1015 family)
MAISTSLAAINDSAVVADGHERAMAAREAMLLQRVERRYATQFTSAGFLGRGLLRVQLRSRIRRRMRRRAERIAPADALYSVSSARE